MKAVARVLTLVSCFVFCAPSAALSAPSSSSSAITGTVKDDQGAAIAGATVTLAGPALYRTSTDAKGAFSVDNTLVGLYRITVTRAGYDQATDDVPLFAGETQTVDVRMHIASFTSLQTIATVRVGGHGSINTGAASVNTVSSADFQNQSALQVTRVLSQIPGLQISFPSNSANAASPGSITIPNIRGATSYETASLIDGHPISVGQYGDNVTTFLNTYMFGNIEVIKGPGANSPVVNNAIGGTTNFRTKDPTPTVAGGVIGGIDNRGGTFSNFSISDTLGKLGFIVDVATMNQPSALDGLQVYYDPGNLSFNGTYQGGVLYSNNSSNQAGNTGSFITNQTSLLACCYTLHGNLDQTAELVKLRYKFSSATTATVSYLGSQSASDQNANTSAYIMTTFNPQAFDSTYSGSLQPGTYPVSNVFPGAFSGEYNNEPIFQGEVSSTIGQDSVLARVYHATISRWQFQDPGGSAAAPFSNNVTLYGVSSGTNPGAINQTFNGTPANVGYYDFYQEPELDQLTGGSFEYQHPIGNNAVEFSVDKVWAKTSDYIYNALPPTPLYNPSSEAISANLIPGSAQQFTTYHVSGHFYLGTKSELTLSDYQNVYNNTYAVSCPLDTSFSCLSSAASTGAGVGFKSTSTSHNDPRLSFVYRPNGNASLRWAMGSAIAPVFAGLLPQISNLPVYNPFNGTDAVLQSNGNVLPETAFGYDLGADVRLKDGTIVSGDAYFTNLFNRFFQQAVPTAQTCDTVACIGAPPPGTPIVKLMNTNISNARFAGLELGIRKAPTVGFGYSVSGALQRGYYYNLPPNFYCSEELKSQGVPCPNQNLNIIAGQNTNGVSVGSYPLSGAISYNGNMRIPYFQAYGEASYTFKGGLYASFGETVFGHNNSLNEPAVAIANATVRLPVNKHISFQISGDNIFNAYPGLLPIYGGGVPISLAGPAPCFCAASTLPASAATTGNVLGPATWRFSFITTLP